MNKLEFLQKLSERLSEELPRGVVLSNLKYYESYIDGEVAKGRSVDAVMDELGDPYMIARTIIDGLESGGFANQDYADETVCYEENAASEEKHRTVTVGNHGCLIAAIVLILIVVVAMVVVGKVIRFVWPVLAPVLLVLLICSIIKDRKR